MFRTVLALCLQSILLGAECGRVFRYIANPFPSCQTILQFQGKEEVTYSDDGCKYNRINEIMRMYVCMSVMQLR